MSKLQGITTQKQWRIKYNPVSKNKKSGYIWNECIGEPCTKCILICGQVGYWSAFGGAQWHSAARGGHLQDSRAGEVNLRWMHHARANLIAAMTAWAEKAVITFSDAFSLADLISMLSARTRRCPAASLAGPQLVRAASAEMHCECSHFFETCVARLDLFSREKATPSNATF